MCAKFQQKILNSMLVGDEKPSFTKIIDLCLDLSNGFCIT